jgi:hypothetical protein
MFQLPAEHVSTASLPCFHCQLSMLTLYTEHISFESLACFRYQICMFPCSAELSLVRPKVKQLLFYTICINHHFSISIENYPLLKWTTVNSKRQYKFTVMFKRVSPPESNPSWKDKYILALWLSSCQALSCNPNIQLSKYRAIQLSRSGFLNHTRWKLANTDSPSRWPTHSGSRGSMWSERRAPIKYSVAVSPSFTVSAHTMELHYIKLCPEIRQLRSECV